MQSPLRLDLFVLALGALGLLAAGFLATRNAGALVMCALCFAGLIAARFAGFSNRALVPLIAGIIAILWMVWVDPPASAHKVSFIAHALGGALVGWALAEYLRGRVAWPQWGYIALAAVVAITLLWEAGEVVGDAFFDTELNPKLSDSAEDIVVGLLAAAATVGLARVLAPRAARE